jgi:hypothetical protein
MSDEEFDRRLEAMKKGRERVQRIQRAMMVEGVHYGKVPGRENDKDAQFGLRKPGAEVLYSLYNYVPDCPNDRLQIVYGDLTNVESPAVRIIVRCEMHAGNLAGPVIGVGYGAASSWETKYRYRTASRTCPKCHKETINKSKFESKGGAFKGEKPWYCFAKVGGCGEEFGPNDPAITEQVTGRTANPDALDLLNTLLKMAEKRAVVDATIRATATSDLFTQDVEDMAGGDDASAAEAVTARAAAPATPAPTVDTPVSFGPAGWKGKRVRDLARNQLEWMLEGERSFGGHTAVWQALAREELKNRDNFPSEPVAVTKAREANAATAQESGEEKIMRERAELCTEIERLLADEDVPKKTRIIYSEMYGAGFNDLSLDDLRKILLALEKAGPPAARKA